jgi:hypothetical protein
MFVQPRCVLCKLVLVFLDRDVDCADPAEQLANVGLYGAECVTGLRTWVFTLVSVDGLSFPPEQVEESHGSTPPVPLMKVELIDLLLEVRQRPSKGFVRGLRDGGIPSIKDGVYLDGG